MVLVMDIQRKALFNHIRMNWLADPSLDVAAWQVEDYRQLTNTELFKRLEKEGIKLHLPTLTSYAEDCETPEELTEKLLEERDLESDAEDRIYLLLFEAWRRFLPERTCLSLFCDELDFLINLYDSDELIHPDQLEDALSNLQALLDENTDLGNEPHEVFQTVSSACAHDLENFIYDYIFDQIDDDNDSYASELLDGFHNYVQDVKWFDLLQIRILFKHNPPQEGNTLLEQLIRHTAEDKDLEFRLEMLSLMIQGGERKDLIELVKKTIPLVNHEADLKELISICSEYYQRLDYDWEENALQELAKNHQDRPDDASVNSQELKSVRTELLKILKKRPI